MIIENDDSCDSSLEDTNSSFNQNFEKMDGEMAFRKTRKAMLGVGISAHLQNEIFKVLSAILHLQKVISLSSFHVQKKTRFVIFNVSAG